MAIIELTISNLGEDKKFLSPVTIMASTDEAKSEQFTRLWASYEIYNWFLMAELSDSKTFNLRKTILVDTYWDNSFYNTYILRRIKKDIVFNSKLEYKFGIRKCEYTLKPWQTDTLYKKMRISSIKSDKKEEKASDFNILFNAVENEQLKKYSYKSRVLYTGMIN